jgi:Fe-S cluster biogenesis protein NfuA
LTSVKELWDKERHPIYGRIPKEESCMKSEVQKVLNKIRPALQADGGDVELVDVENGVVKVRLTGACGGCPMATMTLKGGIEVALKQEIPSVIRVEQV